MRGRIRQWEAQLEKLYDSPRLNRVRAWEICAELAQLYWEYIVELEAQEKWLRRLRPLLHALGRKQVLSYFTVLANTLMAALGFRLRLRY